MSKLTKASGYRVGWGNMGMSKSKTLNRTPNHAVGECYKPHSKLNIHDPDNKYVWAEEKTLLWNSITVVGGALGALGFITGIYCLVFLGMLL
jgi:hypothetical protein